MSTGKPSSSPRVARKRLVAPTQRPRRRRAKRSQPLASATPHRCVVLAVDTGNRSGWSVRVAGQQREFGEADSFDMAALRQIIRWAHLCAARAGGLPLVLVLEAHPWVGSLRVAEGLRAARERWLVAWRGEALSERKVVLVTPSEWRRAVLGKSWVRRRREEVRRQEQLVAAAMVGERVVGGDEAAALLIGCWAAQSGRVGQKLGTTKFRVARARLQKGDGA